MIQQLALAILAIAPPAIIVGFLVWFFTVERPDFSDHPEILNWGKDARDPR